MLKSSSFYGKISPCLCLLRFKEIEDLFKKNRKNCFLIDETCLLS